MHAYSKGVRASTSWFGYALVIARVELLVHAFPHVRGRPSFYNGNG